MNTATQPPPLLELERNSGGTTAARSVENRGQIFPLDGSDDKGPGHDDKRVGTVSDTKAGPAVRTRQHQDRAIKIATLIDLTVDEYGFVWDYEPRLGWISS